MRRIGIIIFVGGFVFFIKSTQAFSQVPSKVKAGEVEKTFKEEKKIKPSIYKKSPPVEIKKPEKTLEIPEGKKILVKDFKFEGNTILKTNYLKRIVQPYKNKELSFKDLQEICNKIEEEYRKRGYFLIKVYLPPQEIKEGVVLIKIIEAKLGEVKIEGARFYKEDFLRLCVHPGPKGILKYQDILKSLLILNEYRDLNVKAIFGKGTSPGTVDIVLKVQDKKPFHSFVEYDNSGSQYISRHRVGARIEYGNLLLSGDTLSFRGVGGFPTRKMKFVNFNYLFPLDTYGTKLGFGYIYSDFNVGREYQLLDVKGTSRIWNINLSHPLIRTLTTDLDITLGFDYKTIKNYILGEISSNDQLRVFKAGFYWNHLDNFWGRTVVSAFVCGGVDGIMGALRHDDPRASRMGAGGEFVKGEFSITRFQKFLGDSYLMANIKGQTASDVLPIPEQISIGGENSVRGFPSSEYLGDEGYIVNCEWIIPLPFGGRKCPFIKDKTWSQIIQLTVFIDYGKVYSKHPLPGESRDEEIAGAGVGMRVSLGEDFFFKIDVGFPVGGKRPSDGSNSRVYFRLSKKIF